MLYACEGLKNDWGAHIGQILLKTYGDVSKSKPRPMQQLEVMPE